MRLVEFLRLDRLLGRRGFLNWMNWTKPVRHVELLRLRVLLGLGGLLKRVYFLRLETTLMGLFLRLIDLWRLILKLMTFLLSWPRRRVLVVGLLRLEATLLRKVMRMITQSRWLLILVIFGILLAQLALDAFLLTGSLESGHFGEEQEMDRCSAVDCGEG